MSASTTTTAYRDMSRRQAIELCYILEEQRDKQIERAKVAEAKVAAERWASWDQGHYAGCDNPDDCGEHINPYLRPLTEVQAGAGASGTESESKRLLELALHLRMYGECAPGGHETWAQFDQDLEHHLRGMGRPTPPDHACGRMTDSRAALDDCTARRGCTSGLHVTTCPESTDSQVQA